MASCIVNMGSYAKKIYRIKNMKKYILYIAFLHCATAKAQLIDRLTLTTNIGTNYSSFRLVSEGYFPTDLELDEKEAMVPAFFFRTGIGTRLNLSKRFSIGTGFNYEEKGWFRKNTPAWNIETMGREFYKFEFYYRYLSIPVDVSCKFGKQKRFSAHVSYMLGYPLPLNGRGIYSDNLQLSPISKMRPSSYRENAIYLDHTTLVGIGYGREIRKDLNLSGKLSYQFGINGVARSPNLGSTMHHQSFSALVELEYPLAKLLKKKGK